MRLASSLKKYSNAVQFAIVQLNTRHVWRSRKSQKVFCFGIRDSNTVFARYSVGGSLLKLVDCASAKSTGTTCLLIINRETPHGRNKLLQPHERMVIKTTIPVVSSVCYTQRSNVQLEPIHQTTA